MNDYDCFGFSSENTLVKYNVKALSSLLVECYLKELHESFPDDYPANIESDFNYEKHLNMCLNGAVWDIKNGTVLKLVENKEIAHAVRGYEKLSHE